MTITIPANPATAAHILEGIVQANFAILQGWAQRGQLPDLIGDIASRRISYKRYDPDEEWKTVDRLYADGGGDCEDLSAAVAAYLRLGGINAYADVYPAAPGLYHVIVKTPHGPRDPSVLGGMMEH